MASKTTTTLEDLQRELQSWQQQYEGAPKTEGPAKWRLHAEFMHKTYASIVAALVQRQDQAARAERAQAAERQRNYDQRLAQVRSAPDLSRRGVLLSQAVTSDCTGSAVLGSTEVCFGGSRVPVRNTGYRSLGKED